MNKVLALRAALRCFTCGLLALIPIIGVPFAIVAMIFQIKASGYAPDNWPVAHRYSRLGVFFAAVGLFLNATIFGCLAFLWIEKQL